MPRWESKNPKAGRGRSPKRTIAQGGSMGPFLRRFYQHQAVVSDKLQKFIFFLVLASLLYAFVFGNAGAIRIVMLKQEKATLETKVAEVNGSIDAIESEIVRLKNDPLMMEKLGRERYGYVYPGDKVYRIVHPPKR